MPNRPILLCDILLSSTYGVYNGFELCESAAVPGKEEYLNSEKYEFKAWDWDRPGNIKDYIRRLNQIRRDWPQLQMQLGLRFHAVEDGRVLFFSRDRPGADGSCSRRSCWTRTAIANSTSTCRWRRLVSYRLEP